MMKSQFLRTIVTVVFDTQPTRLSNSFFMENQLKSRIAMLVNPQTSRRSLWKYVFVLPVATTLLMCSQKEIARPLNAQASATEKRAELAANPPLYVLDGKEQVDVPKMDPQLIDRINVLKGPQAVQAYGEKGKNGVVEITTKAKKP